MRTIKHAAAAVALASLSACATYHPLENKAACTLNADRAMVISMWGAFGIATNLRPEDTPRVCPPASTPTLPR